MIKFISLLDSAIRMVEDRAACNLLVQSHVLGYKLELVSEVYQSLLQSLAHDISHSFDFLKI